MRAWTGFIWLRIWLSGGILCKGNEPRNFVKCGEFLEQLRKYYLLKKYSTPWS
jgi:hypothetical protein